MNKQQRIIVDRIATAIEAFAHRQDFGDNLAFKASAANELQSWMSMIDDLIEDESNKVDNLSEFDHRNATKIESLEEGIDNLEQARVELEEAADELEKFDGIALVEHLDQAVDHLRSL